MDRRTYLAALSKRTSKQRLESLDQIRPRVATVTVDSKDVYEYSSFMGTAAAPWVPPVLLHNACFDNTLAVLNDPALPVKVVGLVHESQRWQTFRGVAVGSPVTITTTLSEVQVSAEGRADLEVTSVVSAHGDVHYVEVATYTARKTGLPPMDLWRDPFPADLPVSLPHAPDFREELGLNDAGSLNTGQSTSLVTRRFPANAGRMWAKLSGDINPIHMSSLSARAFGYHRALLHGAAVEGWLQSHLGIDGTQPLTAATRFRAPVLLPNTLEVVSLEDNRFVVTEAATGRDLVHAVIQPRTRASAKAVRAGAERIPDTQISLPRVNGRISSTALTRAMVEHAGGDDPSLKRALRDVKIWRKDYRQAFVDLSRLDDPRVGVDAATRGLAFLDNAVMTTDGTKLGQIEPETPAAREETVVGTGQLDHEFHVPYKGKKLKNSDLAKQLEKWQSKGIITPGAVMKLTALIEDPTLLDLRDTTVGIIGVGAELAPVRFFLNHGATVAGVARASSKRLGPLVSEASSLAGTLYLSPAEAGDVVSNPGAVAGWLRNHDVDLVMDTLYAPGTQFLLGALGVDCVMRILGEDRDILTAYLGSPSDAYLLRDVPDRDAGTQGGTTSGGTTSGGASGALRKLIPGLGRTPAIRGGVFNGLLDVQGPNYAAAKRIGRWRATVRHAEGLPVSYNIAPMAKTRSVLTSKMLRAAYRGMEKMGLEPFDVDTSTAIMGALLIYDLRAQQRGETLTADFLVSSAVPTGMWKQRTEPQEILPKAVLLGSGAFVR